MNYTTFQSGTLVKRDTAKGFTWIVRYYEGGKYRAMKLGTSEDLPTEKDARKKMSTMTAVINENKTVRTFGQLVERYINEEIPSRPQSASSYKSDLKHLMSEYGEVKLETMLTDLIAIGNWLSNLKSVPTKTRAARPLSKKTKQNIKGLLHRVIECAMRWGYLPVERNPISLVEIKTKGIQPKKRLKPPLTVEQIYKLLDYKELSEHVRVMVKLCVLLGLRISEVLGLQWVDIDMDNLVIHINRGIVGKHVDDTKSEASNTTLPMHPHIAETLKAWKKHSAIINGWLFGSAATGRPFHRDSLQTDHLAPAGIACGITNLGWHSLRHSHRAFLRAISTDPETQQLLMRHANLSTTMEYGIDDELLDVKRPAHNAVVESILKGAK